MVPCMASSPCDTEVVDYHYEVVDISKISQEGGAL